MTMGVASLATFLVGAGLVLGRPGGVTAGDGPRPTADVPDLRDPVSLAGPGRDQVVYQGTVIQGGTVTIGVDGTIPPGTTFRWKQVEGPSVVIEDPSAAKIRFTVPIDAKRLAFVATVADGHGSRDVRVTVPISPPPTVPPTPTADEGPTASGTSAVAVADAGDDQIGLVGRRITLNGSRSRPQNRVGFRWMHLSGPALADPRQEGPYFVFVPTAPGVYRFALVVGLESQVSMPSVVSVEVGQRPGTAAAPILAAEAQSPLTRWARAAVATIPGSEETSAQIGDVFEAIAGRAALYTSFSQLQSELTRRLDVVVPLEPAARSLWSAQVFVPLSQLTAVELMAAGIDLRLPSASDRPLESSQKERIGAFYRSLAVAFRSRPAKP
jgi:hypothetical protein